MQENVFIEEPYGFRKTWITKPYSEMDPQGEASESYRINNICWKLILFPQGYGGIKDHLSIFLRGKNIINPHPVQFSLRTVGGSKSAGNSCEFVFSKYVSNQGFFKFIPLNDIKSYLTPTGQLNLELIIEFRPKYPINGTSFRKDTGYVGLRKIKNSYFLNAFIQIMFHLNSFAIDVISSPNYDDQLFELIRNTFKFLFLMPVAPTAIDIYKFLEIKSEGEWIQTNFNFFITTFFKSHVELIQKYFLSEVTSQKADEPISYYSIPINAHERRYLSLENFLSSFTNTRPLNSQTIRSSTETESFPFITLPPILVFDISRFQNDPGYHKNKLVFKYPFELDMTPFSKDQSVATKYELFSIVGHQGEMFNSQFYAICRPSYANHKWLKFEDNFVNQVNESVALEGNYGSIQYNSSAILLVYIRIDKKKDIMSQFDLPREIVQEYEEWCQKSVQRSFPSSNVQLYTLDDYKERIQSDGTIYNESMAHLELEYVPDVHKYQDLLSEIRNVVSNRNITLWKLDSNMIPSEELNLSTTVKEIQRVFVSPKSMDPQNNIPFLIALFESNCLSIKSFISLNIQSNASIALQQLRRSIDLSIEEKCECYLLQNKTPKRISLTQPISNKKNYGILVFQLKNRRAIEPELHSEGNRSIDLLPEYQTNLSYVQYFNFINNISAITAVSIDDPQNRIDIQISNKDRLGNLLQCIRILLHMSDDSSLLLFKKENNKPSKIPIDINLGTVSQFIIDNFVYFKIFDGIPQDAMSSSSLFECSAVDCNLHLIENCLFIMNKNFLIRDIFQKFSMKYPLFDNLRMVQINQSKIICTLNEDSHITPNANLSYQIQVIPTDQNQIQPERLLRVAFSNQCEMPSIHCFGQPFYLLVLPNEKMVDTINRINQIVQLNLNDSVFLYLDDLTSVTCLEMKETSILFNFMKGNKSKMLYIVPNNIDEVRNRFANDANEISPFI